jgi:UDP-glucose 4-epimerase
MILVTGGLGFLGCNLAYSLAKKGRKLLLAQRRISNIPSFLEPRVDNNIEIAQCDILDLSNLFYILNKYRITSIIHLAGTYGQKGKLCQCIDTNVNGTVNLLEASRIMGIDRVTFLSSHSVYQRSRKVIHQEEEDLPLKSAHYISLTKKACEMICHHYAHEHGLLIPIIRASQIYGPLYATGVNPLQKMVENSLAGKATHLPEVHPENGNNFMYVKDCARAIGLIHLAEKPQFTIYNLGDKYVTYGQMAEAVRKII